MLNNFQEKSFYELDKLTLHSRTWATVNLSHLKYNLAQIRAKLPDGNKVMAVVKADGYGHGDVRVAKVMLENGVDFLAVSNIDEALSLRKNELLSRYDYELLILGYTPVEFAKILLENNIQQTVISFEYGKLYNEECKRHNIKPKVQIKIDTGMSRLGIDVENLDEVISIYNMDNVTVEGIFTHLSSADGLDDASKEFTRFQQDKFDTLINKISNLSINIGMTHLQNSAGAMIISQKYDYARVGLLLYGVSPISIDTSSDNSSNDYIKVKPVMELKSVVAMVKEIDKDTAVSYGRHFVSSRKMQVATIPIGYADGYSRALSRIGEVLINGKFAPILGNVCMDQIIVDVTEIETKVGDIVTLIGNDGENSISLNDIATLVGTIPYEIACLIGKRVPRVEIE